METERSYPFGTSFRVPLNPPSRSPSDYSSSYTSITLSAAFDADDCEESPAGFIREPEGFMPLPSDESAGSSPEAQHRGSVAVKKEESPAPKKQASPAPKKQASTAPQKQASTAPKKQASTAPQKQASTAAKKQASPAPKKQESTAPKQATAGRKSTAGNGGPDTAEAAPPEEETKEEQEGEEQQEGEEEEQQEEEGGDETAIVILEDVLELPPDDPEDPPVRAQVLVCVATCAAIAYYIHGTRAEYPAIFKANLLWQETFILRVILTYLCVAFCGQSVMPCLNRRFLISRGYAVGDQETFQESRGIQACILGTIFMGIGAGLSLSFPETVFLQFPISGQLAISSICGILIAAIMFALLNKLESFQAFLVEGRYFKSAFADQNWKLHYGLVAIFLGILDFVVLRTFHAMTKGVDVAVAGIPHMARRSPYTAGAILAILQFSLRCYCKMELDMATGFRGLVGSLFTLGEEGPPTEKKEGEEEEGQKEEEQELTQPLVEKDEEQGQQKEGQKEAQKEGQKGGQQKEGQKGGQQQPQGQKGGQQPQAQKGGQQPQGQRGGQQGQEQGQQQGPKGGQQQPQGQKGGQQQQGQKGEAQMGGEPGEEPEEGEEPMEGEGEEAKEEAPPFLLPPAVQLIGPFLISLIVYLLQGDVMHLSECHSNDTSRCRARCPFALDNWLSVIVRPLLGSFIQAFGAFLTGTGWVGHLVGVTDLRISSFLVLPISTVIMALTAVTLDKMCLFACCPGTIDHTRRFFKGKELVWRRSKDFMKTIRRLIFATSLFFLCPVFYSRYTQRTHI